MGQAGSAPREEPSQEGSGTSGERIASAEEVWRARADVRIPAHLPCLAASGKGEAIECYNLEGGGGLFQVRTREGYDTSCLSLLRYWHGLSRVLIVGEVPSRDLIRTGVAKPAIGASILESDVVLYDPLARLPLVRFRGHTNRVMSLDPVAFSERLIASGAHDHTLRLWDLHTNEQALIFQHEKFSVTGICSVDSREWLCSGSQDGTVRVWDVEKACLVPDGIVTHEGRLAYVQCVRYGGEQFPFVLSCCTNKTVNLIDLKSLTISKSFRCETTNRVMLCHPERPHQVFVGGQAGRQGLIALWDTRMETEPIQKDDFEYPDPSGISDLVSIGRGRFASCAWMKQDANSRDAIRTWNDEFKHFFSIDTTKTNELCCIRRVGEIDDDGVFQEDEQERIAYLFQRAARLRIGIVSITGVTAESFGFLIPASLLVEWTVNV